MSPTQADIDDRDNVRGAADLRVNIGFTLGRQLFSALIQVITVLVIARWLGPEGNGQYALSILVPTLLCSLLTLGIPAANVYYVGRGDLEAPAALHSILRIWVLLSLLGTTAAALTLSALSARLFPAVPRSLLFFGLAAFPPALLQLFLVSLLQALQDFRRFNAALLAGPCATLAFVLGAALLMRSGAEGVLSAYVAGQIVSAVVTYGLLKGSAAGSARQREAGPAYTSWALSYGSKAYLNNVLAVLNYRANLFLVNLFLGPAATGIYVVAGQVVERLWMLSSAVSAVILPQLASHYKSRRTQSSLTPLATRWVLAVTGLGALSLALLSFPLVHILFGSAYRGAVLPLIALLPGIVALSVSRVLSNDLAARGRPELNMYIAGGVLVGNLLANVLLIPALGPLGAAIATTLAYVGDVLLRLTLFARFSALPWWRPLVLTRADWRDAWALPSSVLPGKGRRSE